MRPTPIGSGPPLLLLEAFDSSPIKHPSSLITPHPSAVHSSLLTPHSSLLTPHSSLLTPHSSLLTPHSSQRTKLHIGRFGHMVDKRKGATKVLEQTTHVIKFLKMFTKFPHTAPLPFRGSPKVMRPICEPTYHAHNIMVRQVSKMMAEETARRYASMGEGLQRVNFGGICEQLKSVLLMAPRRCPTHQPTPHLNSSPPTISPPTNSSSHQLTSAPLH